MTRSAPMAIYASQQVRDDCGQELLWRQAFDRHKFYSMQIESVVAFTDVLGSGGYLEITLSIGNNTYSTEVLDKLIFELWPGAQYGLQPEGLVVIRKHWSGR